MVKKKPRNSLRFSYLCRLKFCLANLGSSAVPEILPFSLSKVFNSKEKKPWGKFLSYNILYNSRHHR